jgi:N-methylhydantoinase A/oxoprolinase/acetone carboxylase beta subunit
MYSIIISDVYHPTRYTGVRSAYGLIHATLDLRVHRIVTVPFYKKKMEMQQIMEMLKAMQEKADADRTKDRELLLAM